MKKFVLVLTFIVVLFGQACVTNGSNTITPTIPKPTVKFTTNN